MRKSKQFGAVAGLCLAAMVAVGAPAGASPDEVVLDDAVFEIGHDAATIGFTEIPAPNVAGSCEQTAIFPAPDCTLFSGQFQAPPGRNVVRSVSIRTGPNAGPMRVDVLQAQRSQSGAGGIICCVSVAQSEIFTPTPNQINTIPVSLPFNNSVIDIDGERVEVIDYLAISVDAGTSLPILAAQGLLPMSAFHPSIRPGEERILSSAGTFPLSGGAVMTMSAIACSADGTSIEDVCQTVGTPGASFTGINPSRLLDTRSSGRAGAGSTTRVQVASAPGVPAGAAGAVLNVTAVNPLDGGFLTVFPCDEPRPTASNVNFGPRQTIANAVAATFGAGGDVCVFSSAETHLLVDLNGALTGGFTGLTPSRLLDSRSSVRVAAASTTRVSVANAAGVPSGAAGAVLNVTAVNPLDGGFLTVFPCDEPRPTASNVNFAPRQTIANAAVATFGAGGEVCVFSSADTHLLVDLNGAVAAGFGGLTPDRLLDTRSGGRVGAGSTTRVRVAGAAGVPDGVVAAVLNVTAVNPLGGGFLTVFPCGATPPTASNVNFAERQTIANAAVATFGSDGEVCVFSSAATHLLVDLNGTFS